jgi:hypothetical protein
VVLPALPNLSFPQLVQLLLVTYPSPVWINNSTGHTSYYPHEVTKLHS